VVGCGGGTHWTGGLADPRDGLDTVKKRRKPSPTRNTTLVIQATA